MAFHIFNGESTQAGFAGTGIKEEGFSWREDLLSGGSPSGLLDNTQSWLSFRASQLSTHFEMDLPPCLEELVAQEKKLEACLSLPEVMLWFEYDSFCQINLTYILWWFGRRSIENDKLSLPPFEEILETGLGPLQPEQLKDLFERRQTVSPNMIHVATGAWTAYTSPDPIDVARFLATDSTAIPFLRRSMSCHLARFPSTENGLSRVENRALQHVADGKRGFGDLFREYSSEDGAYGYGDSHLFLILKKLTQCRVPLLVAEASYSATGSEFLHTSYKLTDAGRKVLSRSADHIELNGIEQWLGGAHLSSQEFWRWDPQAKHLLRASL